MSTTKTFPPPPSYIGHVRNGVVVLDHHASLSEGQAVRVEPLATPATLDADRMNRLQKMRQLFEQWTEEDRQLTPEEADRLHSALDQSHGLEFRVPEVS